MANVKLNDVQYYVQKKEIVLTSGETMDNKLFRKIEKISIAPPPPPLPQTIDHLKKIEKSRSVPLPARVPQTIAATSPSTAVYRVDKYMQQSTIPASEKINQDSLRHDGIAQDYEYTTGLMMSHATTEKLPSMVHTKTTEKSTVAQSSPLLRQTISTTPPSAPTQNVENSKKQNMIATSKLHADILSSKENLRRVVKINGDNEYLPRIQNEVSVSKPTDKKVTMKMVTDDRNDTDCAKYDPHFARNGRYFYKLYNCEQLFDVIIEIGRYKFNAHAAILCCYSKYFSDLYKSQRVHRLSLEDISTDTFKSTLLYMYTGDITINTESAAELLECAEYLGVSELSTRCNDFLNSLNFEDLGKVLKSHVRQGTLAPQWQRAADNFSILVNTNNFLELDVETVSKLVSRDDININSEMDVVTATFKWLLHSKQRERYTRRLLEEVRHLLLSTSDIKNILTDFQRELKNSDIKTILCEWLWNVTCNENGIEVDAPKPNLRSKSNMGVNIPVEDDKASESRITTANFATQCGVTSSHECQIKGYLDSESDEEITEDTRTIPSPCLFAVGGFADNDKSSQGRSVDIYNVEKNVWESFTMLPEPRNKHDVVILDGYIYVIGGSSSTTSTEETPTNNIFRLNIATRNWETLRSMREKRIYHATAVFSGRIFIIGGQTRNGKILSTVEYFNPAKNVWFKATPSRYCRMAAATSTYQNIIYLAGGYGHEMLTTQSVIKRQVLDIVERYNPREKSWSTVAPLLVPRTNARLVVLGDLLYIFGGLCPVSSEFRNTFEHAMMLDAYDSSTDMWTSISTIMSPRFDCGVSVVGSNLFVVGGKQLTNIMDLDTMERYNFNSGKWTQMKPLPSRRSGLQCAAYIASH